MQYYSQLKLSTAEYFFFSICLLVEMLALLNFAVLPNAPIVPLVTLLAVLLITALFEKRVMFIMLLFAIFASESLYIEIGSAVIRLIDLLVLYVLTYLTLQWLVRHEKSFEFLPIFKYSLGLLVLAALVSLVDTISVGNSILELIQIIELIIAAVLFYNLIKTERDINFIFLALLIYSTLDSIWILYQYATGQLVGRHIGLLGTLASELGYGLALSTAYFYMVRKYSHKLLFLLSGFIQIAAIYLTRTRGLLITGILMAMVCNLLFAINRRKLISFTLVFGAIMFAFLLSYFGLPAEFQERAASIIEGGQMREFRLIIWAVALKAWHNYPWLGVGFGNAEIALEAFAPKPFGIALTALANVKTPHNEFLSFAMQGGIVGFIIGIIFYLTLLGRAIANYMKHARLTDYSIIMLSFVIGLVMYNFANDTLLAGNGILVMCFIAIISRIYS